MTASKLMGNEEGVCLTAQDAIGLVLLVALLRYSFRICTPLSSLGYALPMIIRCPECLGLGLTSGNTSTRNGSEGGLQKSLDTAKAFPPQQCPGTSANHPRSP